MGEKTSLPRWPNWAFCCSRVLWCFSWARKESWAVGLLDGLLIIDGAMEDLYLVCRSPLPYELRVTTYEPPRKCPFLSPLSLSLWLSLARSLARLPSKRRRLGEWRRPCQFFVGRFAGLQGMSVLSLPFLSCCANRTPKPPNMCYLYSDLTMDFTY